MRLTYKISTWQVPYKSLTIRRAGPKTVQRIRCLLHILLTRVWSQVPHRLHRLPYHHSSNSQHHWSDLWAIPELCQVWSRNKTIEIKSAKSILMHKTKKGCKWVWIIRNNLPNWNNDSLEECCTLAIVLWNLCWGQNSSTTTEFDPQYPVWSLKSSKDWFLICSY